MLFCLKQSVRSQSESIDCEHILYQPTYNSPITEVISSNEESEQLPVIVHINHTSLESKQNTITINSKEDALPSNDFT